MPKYCWLYRLKITILLISVSASIPIWLHRCNSPFFTTKRPAAAGHQNHIELLNIRQSAGGMMTVWTHLWRQHRSSWCQAWHGLHTSGFPAEVCPLILHPSAASAWTCEDEHVCQSFVQVFEAWPVLLPRWFFDVVPGLTQTAPDYYPFSITDIFSDGRTPAL